VLHRVRPYPPSFSPSRRPLVARWVQPNFPHAGSRASTVVPASGKMEQVRNTAGRQTRPDSGVSVDNIVYLAVGKILQGVGRKCYIPHFLFSSSCRPTSRKTKRSCQAFSLLSLLLRARWTCCVFILCSFDLETQRDTRDPGRYMQGYLLKYVYRYMCIGSCKFHTNIHSNHSL